MMQSLLQMLLLLRKSFDTRLQILQVYLKKIPIFLLILLYL